MSHENSNPPEGWPEDKPWMPVTREEFTTMLLGIRDAASMRLSILVGGQTDSPHALREAINARRTPADAGEVGELRAIWHTAEVALGVLLIDDDGRYIVKREAIEDMRRTLAWLDTP